MHFIQKKNYFFHIILWITLWASLSSNNTGFDGLISKVNTLRYFAPIFFAFFCFFFFKFLPEVQINMEKKIIILLFFIIFISQIAGLLNLFFFNEDIMTGALKDAELIISGYVPNFYHSIYLSLTFFLTALILFFCNNKIIKILLIINFIFLTCLSFYTTINVLIEHGYNGNSLNTSNYFQNSNFLQMAPQKSLGLSRSLTFLSIFFSLFLFKKMNRKIFLNIILVTFIIFINCIILQLQSRSSIYFLIFYYIILISFFLIRRNYRFALIIFIFLNLLPVILYPAITNFEKYKKNSTIELLDISMGNRAFTTDPNKNSNLSTPNIELANNFSSGRLHIWKGAINRIKENSTINNLVGFGSMADRILVNENMSNAFFYAQISSGIIGSISYLLIIIFTFFKCFSLIVFSFNKNKFLFYESSAATILIYLCARTIVENGFVQFGIDNMIFCSLLFYLCNFHYKK